MSFRKFFGFGFQTILGNFAVEFREEWNELKAVLLLKNNESKRSCMGDQNNLYKGLIHHKSTYKFEIISHPTIRFIWRDKLQFPNFMLFAQVL